MRWYSPRDWIEDENEEEEGDHPPADSAKTTKLENDNSTGEKRDEGSPQGTSSVVGGDAEMEMGEVATKDNGDNGDTAGGDSAEVGEAGDGWDNEGWGEEDWDMIDNDDDDGEAKSRQQDSPSQDNSVTEPPAVKVCILYILSVFIYSATNIFDKKSEKNLDKWLWE